MRRDIILALSLASMSGFFAAFGAYSWMPSITTKEVVVQSQPDIDLTTVVVAKSDLTFGSALSKDHVIEAKWPANNVPPGSFKSVQEFFAEQESRVVLEGMKAKEPVIRGKVTGPGQRATLSSMLSEGKKAVSIHVNDVIGVSGFVMPGDFVDILLTNEPKAEEGKKNEAKAAYTDLLLEKVRVLAVDQTFDPKYESPKPVRTVTVEATLADAQKITLASTVGTLSLVLRNSGGVAATADARRVNVSDLSGDNGEKTEKATLQPTNAVADPAPKVALAKRKDGEGDDVRPGDAKVSVYRDVKSSEYSVTRVTPVE